MLSLDGTTKEDILESKELGVSMPRSHGRILLIRQDDGVEVTKELDL